MKGSIRERRPGSWELIVQLPRDPVTGRAKQLSRMVHGTKREAQRALAELVTKVSAGKISSSATTLSQLLVQWLDLVSAQLAATTVREYRRLVATRLAPDLGHLALRRITTQRLDSYYAGLAREQRSVASVVETKRGHRSAAFACGVPAASVAR